MYGDHALARELQQHERDYAESRSWDSLARTAATILARYELTQDAVEWETR